MKKAITILAVLILVAGFAFAADITLTTTVEQIAPAFKIEYKGADGTAAAKTGTVTLDSGIDEGAVTAMFLVSQYGQKNSDNEVVDYSRFGGKNGTPVTVTVKAYPFINKSDSTIKSQKPTVTATYASVSTSNPNNNNRFTLPTQDPTAVTTDANYNSIALVATYKGKKVYDQAIGTITAVWGAEDDIPFGTYEADIVIETTGI